ncbi:penicillin-binding transpeptidase domain-containing protein [Streptomyces sp. NPDC048639]|uniref:penicillin-binding transpeptidase domain-containing protein n=1 Tax=Streptomyces sp. NPDC048639 TaxID=3365581 RepID=UPI003718AB3F
MRHPRTAPTARAGAAALAAAAIASLVAGCESDQDPATKAATSFLAAWADGDARKAASYTDDPKTAEAELTRLGNELALEKAQFTPGEKEDGKKEGRARVPFRARLTLGGAGTWTYGSGAEVRKSGDGWKVHFAPSVLHPALDQPFMRLVRERELPRRAGILAADGTNLAPEGSVWNIRIWPAELSDPDRAYRALKNPALGTEIDTEALKSRVDAAKPNQAVPVITLRDAVYRKVREDLLPIPGFQFYERPRAVATTARPLIGTVQPATDRTLKNAGANAEDTDEVGTAGLQYRYQKQLAGRPSITVRAVNEVEEAGPPLYRSPAKAGKPVRTTIDPDTQAAAEKALAKVKKKAALVALRPADGAVLAVANTPDSAENRAFSGRYAPGSTFKVVTTAALLRSGVGPDSTVPCPRTVSAGGRAFQNQDEFGLPPGTTFRKDFAQSCNTAFIGLADRLGDGGLARAAGQFGIGGTWDVGAATFDGSVPEATTAEEKAASMIGQGRVEASPLVMASVAATVRSGAFRQPVLVPGAVKARHRTTNALDPDVVRQLRTLMGAVVTEGSGTALRGISGSPAAKTGTAEFGTENPPRTHAWMIGYRGDLAFAILVEDGGSGGKDAGPLASAFLRGLD